MRKVYFNAVRQWVKSRQQWEVSCEICWEHKAEPPYVVYFARDGVADVAAREHMRSVHGVDAVVHVAMAREEQ